MTQSAPPLEASAEPVLDALRNYATSSTVPKNAHPAGSLIARLKAINRQSNASATHRREATSEARQAIGATNLELQNLMYERRHLEREIEKCRSFAFVYQDVALHTMAEFLTISPEELRTPGVLVDEHQLMLNRLKFELDERRRLEERRLALIQERDAILSDSKKFQAEVDKLADPFEKLADMTLEVQRMLNEILPPPPTPPEVPQPLEASEALALEKEAVKDEPMTDAAS